ncbi:MAG: class I SAM-dependent methyltransferase [Ardenticatenaceae bacterium]
MDYSFIRYLAAKKSVDDRALNEHVWQTMVEALPPASAEKPLRILEVGAGIGTMVERLVGRGVLSDAVYTALDAQASNIEQAKRRLQAIPATIRLELEAIDFFDFVLREQNRQDWDLIIAHAFLDLVHLPTTLPLLFSLLRPGGFFYFTINFDGATILQPTIDPTFDAQVEALYHRTMDERITAGNPSGDSQTGRHLFQQLPQAGTNILAAGSSDWVVFAHKNGYPADEAYFLHFIVNTMHGALNKHPELDQTQFQAWIAQRHAQIDAGTLLYIAHQLDFFGTYPPTSSNAS